MVVVHSVLEQIWIKCPYLDKDYHSMKAYVYPIGLISARIKILHSAVVTFLLSKMSLNIVTVKLFLYYKNQFMKNLCSGTHRGGFQFLLILGQWGISFMLW